MKIDPSEELLAASDQAIEDAVAYADPMLLRGLLHQLTGDASLVDVPVEFDLDRQFRRHARRR